MQYLNPFTVSNYAQKLINELENSCYEKNENKLKLILEELSLFANHFGHSDLIRKLG